MFKKNYIGFIDIGSYSINFTIAENDVNNTFRVLEKNEVYYSGFYNKKFIDINDFKQSIIDSVNNINLKKEYKLKKVYVSVPAEFSYVQCKDSVRSYANKKRITQDDIKDLYHIADTFSDDSEYSIINKQIIEFNINEDEKIDNPIGEKVYRIMGNISFILAEKYFLNEVLIALNSIGVNNVEFISSPLAQSLYYLDDDKRKEGAMIVDIGYLTSYVSVVSNNSLGNLFSFSVAGGLIESDLMEAFNLNKKEAKKLKEKVVLSLDVKENDFYDLNIAGKDKPLQSVTVHDIINYRLSSIAKILKKVKKIIGSEKFNEMDIYLTGGGISNIKGAKDHLSKILSKNIDMLQGKIPQFINHYETSIPGLLKEGLNKEKKKSNKIFNIFNYKSKK